MEITVIVRDNFPGTDPLIYCVTVENLADESEVLRAVKSARMYDLGELREDDELSLDLLFAFAGDLPPIADWRA